MASMAINGNNLFLRGRELSCARREPPHAVITQTDFKFRRLYSRESRDQPASRPPRGILFGHENKCGKKKLSRHKCKGKNVYTRERKARAMQQENEK